MNHPARFRWVVRLKVFPTPINFRAVADANHQDANPLGLEAVDDTVTPHAHAMEADSLAAHGNGFSWEGVFGEGADCGAQPALYRGSQ